MRRSAFVRSAVASLLLFTANAYSQSQQDLINGSANTDNVVNYGMSYSQHRYSTQTLNIATKTIRPRDRRNFPHDHSTVTKALALESHSHPSSPQK